ncbi:MAG: S8 family peptidase, partial [Peptostreptococcaceae bacterium]
MEDIQVKLLPFEIKNEITNLSYSIPYGVSMINAPSFWKEGYTGKGVTIAIIDTGCDKTHPNLEGRIIEGRNFTSDDNSNPNIFNDYQGHGTHVAGTIAAKKGSTGVVGVAPEANLIILKALDKTGGGKVEWIINAIDYAISKKVDIISMSLGASKSIPQLYDAIKRAVSKEILVVCAAGNEGDNANPNTDELAYPGGYNEVISVGAVDQNRSAAKFTNSNKEVDVVAPGVNILSTYPGGKYANLSGTSMATPHVSGALALLIQFSRDEFKRNLSEMEVYGRLMKNTTTLKMARTL